MFVRIAIDAAAARALQPVTSDTRRPKGRTDGRSTCRTLSTFLEPQHHLANHGEMERLADHVVAKGAGGARQPGPPPGRRFNHATPSAHPPAWRPVGSGGTTRTFASTRKPPSTLWSHAATRCGEVDVPDSHVGKRAS